MALLFNSHTFAEDAELISVRISTLFWGNGSIQDLEYLNGESYEILNAYSRGLSMSIQYQGVNPIVFYRQEKNADGEVLRVPVGHAMIPQGAKDVLLIFRKDNESKKERYQISVVERDFEKFPVGSYQICNYSSYNLAGKIGDERFTLGLGEVINVQMPEDVRQNVEVKFANEMDNAWTIFYSSVWGNKENRRVNIFIANRPHKATPVEVRRFEQYVD